MGASQKLYFRLSLLGIVFYETRKKSKKKQPLAVQGRFHQDMEQRALHKNGPRILSFCLPSNSIAPHGQMQSKVEISFLIISSLMKSNLA